MQLMDKGSSSRCLSNARILYNPLNNNGLKLNWDIEGHITYILHQTILGLKYIHDNSQIHRDIKAGNVLLNSKGDGKFQFHAYEFIGTNIIVLMTSFNFNSKNR